MKASSESDKILWPPDISRETKPVLLSCLILTVSGAVLSKIYLLITRAGVEVSGGDVGLNPLESRPLLLQVPPGYNPGDDYRLRIEGYHR